MFGMLLKGNTKVTNVVTNFNSFANDPGADQNWTNTSNAQTAGGGNATVPNAGLGNGWNSDIFKATGYATQPPAYALAVTGIRWRIVVGKNSNDGIQNELVQWHEYVNGVRTGLQVDFTDLTFGVSLINAEDFSSLNQRTEPMSIQDFANSGTGVGFSTFRAAGSATLQQHLLDHIYAEYDYEF